MVKGEKRNVWKEVLSYKKEISRRTVESSWRGYGVEIQGEFGTGNNVIGKRGESIIRNISFLPHRPSSRPSSSASASSSSSCLAENAMML